MAVVRITNQLRDDVCAAAHEKFAAQIKAAEESRPTSEEYGDYIYEVLFGKYLPIMDQLPEGFFPKVNTIEIADVCGESVHLAFPLSTPKAWPTELPPDAPAKRDRYGFRLQLTDDLAWGELYAEVSAWRKRVASLRQQAREFRDGVRRLLDAYTTLAPALKAWPPLWDLLPEYAKTKHKEIVVRATSDKEQPDVDTAKLTAVMAASKLLK